YVEYPFRSSDGCHPEDGIAIDLVLAGRCRAEGGDLRIGDALERYAVRALREGPGVLHPRAADVTQAIERIAVRRARPHVPGIAGERRPELLTRRRQVEVAERPPGAHDMERPLREEVQLSHLFPVAGCRALPQRRGRTKKVRCRPSCAWRRRPARD